MHASAFLIRETKIGSSLCSVFRLGFLWELVIREERFWNFYCGVVTRRHSFGFSRNNMKGALYHWRNPMGAERQKGKFLIFRFGVVKVLGMKSLTCRFLNGGEKRLNAPSKNFEGTHLTFSLGKCPLLHCYSEMKKPQRGLNKYKT